MNKTNINDEIYNLQTRVAFLEAKDRESVIGRGHRDLEKIRIDINLKKKCREDGSFILVVLGDAVIDRISKGVCEMEWDSVTKAVVKIYGCPIACHPNDPEACYAVELR